MVPTASAEGGAPQDFQRASWPRRAPTTYRSRHERHPAGPVSRTGSPDGQDSFWPWMLGLLLVLTVLAVPLVLLLL